MDMKKLISIAIIASIPMLTGMGLLPKSGKGGCKETIDIAWEELNSAKADNVIGGLRLTKAAGILAQARVRFEAGEYESCIEKAERAREVIRTVDD
ncbi:MAG: hypothetical protein OEZ10_12155 [Gammaproteobacteria bacterium]|nr:hypothetical protein [Gammaproteobacteria bacterium]